MQQLKFTTISQHEQLPEIPTHIILVIKNLNEFFSTGSIQGNTYTVEKKNLFQNTFEGVSAAEVTLNALRSKGNLNQNTIQ